MFGAEIFPDVELVVTGWLRTALAARPEAFCAGVHVSNRLPAVRPARAVTVRRDGGPRTGHFTEAALIGVNVYAATEQDATNLALMVKALLESQAPTPVEHVTGGGFSPIPEDVGFRRFATFELTVTSETLAMP